MVNQNQSQGQPTNQAITGANAAKARSQESSSELAQSSGEISRLLLAKSKAGFEFGSLGSAQGSTQRGSQSEYSNQSELSQSSGQISQILNRESNQ